MIPNLKTARDKLHGALSSFTMGDVGFYSILSGVASTFMIFGGIIPYIPQYLQIKSSKNADGFSLYVCFTLLVANKLRIFFWFGHRFETPLLIQSVVMIVAMFVMIHLCISIKSGTEIILSKQKQFSDFKLEDFWQWTDFSSYIQCILTLSLAVGLITMALISSTFYVEGLGLAAVLSEALLGAPQFYANFQNKSTLGMSVQMVLLWLAGDIFKTVYFIARSAPLQFWLCGTLQVTLDFAILYQVFYYGYKNAMQKL